MKILFFNCTNNNLGRVYCNLNPTLVCTYNIVTCAKLVAVR